MSDFYCQPFTLGLRQLLAVKPRRDVGSLQVRAREGEKKKKVDTLQTYIFLERNFERGLDFKHIYRCEKQIV